MTMKGLSASLLLLFGFTLIFVIQNKVVLAADGDPAKMKVINFAGAPIELYWINHYEPLPNNELNIDRSISDPLRNGSDTMINSFDTHEFLVRFHGHKDGDYEGRFMKGPQFENIYIRFNEEAGFYIQKATKTDEMKKDIENDIASCRAQGALNMKECLTELLAGRINDLQSTSSDLRKYHFRMADKLRNYTCADESLPSTEPIRVAEYEDDTGAVYEANILFDTPNAKIWYIDDFITPEECDVLLKHGAPRLKRATVAAEDGTSVVSENRKAQQALYDLNKDDIMQDRLGPLYMRILGLTNAHTGFDLTPEGQEQFTIIQYNPTDQYMPHCDGACNGEKHIKAGRVATSVLYCKVAERGGAITFSRADVYYKPRNGSAVFFSYRGADGTMDDGYTEHSSCPVIEGEKWATTAWMRDGVSLEETWELFDPQGVLILDTSAESTSTSVNNANTNELQEVVIDATSQ